MYFIGSSAYVELPEEMQCISDVSLLTGGVRRLGIEQRDDDEPGHELMKQGPRSLSALPTAGI